MAVEIDSLTENAIIISWLGGDNRVCSDCGHREVAHEEDGCLHSACFCEGFKPQQRRYEFIYNRNRETLSRCLCEHGSFWRGGKSQLCHHARQVKAYLEGQLNRKVIA